MRRLAHTAIALIGLAAASGCAVGFREPQPASTQGGEAMTLLSPHTLVSANLTDAHFAERLREAYGSETEAAKVELKGPALSAGDLSEQHTAWKQAGAKLDASKATNLDDLPKCQEL